MAAPGPFPLRCRTRTSRPEATPFARVPRPFRSRNPAPRQLPVEARMFPQARSNDGLTAVSQSAKSDRSRCRFFCWEGSRLPGRACRDQWIIGNDSAADPEDSILRGGTCRPGIGAPWNSLRQGTASQRAHWLARLRRALSVAMPVLAYICR